MPRKTQEEKLAYKAKRARIIDLYNADGDWHRLAMELNVPKSTAYRWVKKGDEINGHGGRYNQKITAEHSTVKMLMNGSVPVLEKPSFIP